MTEPTSTCFDCGEPSTVEVNGRPRCDMHAEEIECRAAALAAADTERPPPEGHVPGIEARAVQSGKLTGAAIRVMRVASELRREPKDLDRRALLLRAAREMFDIAMELIVDAGELHTHRIVEVTLMELERECERELQERSRAHGTRDGAQ